MIKAKWTNEDSLDLQPTCNNLQQLATMEGDLISRADAIEAILNRLQSLESYASDVYRRGLYEAQEIIEALPSAEPTAEEVWSVAQKVFYSTLTYREAVDYLKEVEEQHERFNQQSRCD